MRSMTGFGQAGRQNDRYRVTVTLRGVNHRYLDIVLKLRDDYRACESALRELLAGRLRRGRVEVAVEIEELATRAVEVGFDRELARALHDLSDELVTSGLVDRQLGFGDLLRLPEVIQVRSPALDWTDDDTAVLLEAAAAALGQMIDARETEGEKLLATFLGRLAALDELTVRLTERRSQLPRQIAEALHQRVAELLEDSLVDEARLAQEVALLVDRSDVSEELDRLRSHLEHFRTLVDEDDALGKRLDFLAQEIFRELNTVGAKCRDSDMIRLVLDGKSLCEQIREQVQNVE